MSDEPWNLRKPAAVASKIPLPNPESFNVGPTENSLDADFQEESVKLHEALQSCHAVVRNYRAMLAREPLPDSAADRPAGDQANDN